MRKREKEELTPEEKYKNSRKGGIALIVIGALALIATVVVVVAVYRIPFAAIFTYAQELISPLAYGVFFILIGMLVLAIGKKNYKKAKQQAATAAQASAPSNIAVEANDDDDDQPIREAQGRSLHDLIADAANVEKVTFVDGDDELTADFLWCNSYSGVWYIVVGRNEDDNYMKYILRVDKNDPSLAHYEMNDSVRDVIIDDFARAVDGYAQQNGYTAQASGGKQGRLGRLKSKFKSGAGEEKKSRVTAFIAVAVMYAVIFIIAMVMSLPLFRSGFRVIPGTRLAIAWGYLLIVPSFLLYFGAHNPFNFKKSAATSLIVFGIIMMIACDVSGIILLTRNAQYLNPENTVENFIVTKFVPIALCVSTVAYILVYLVWCKGLSSKMYATMSYVTTIVFPIVTALIIAAVVLYIAWILLMWLINAIRILFGGTPMARGFKQGWTGERSSGGGYQIIDEHGYTRTLTHYEGNRYRDDTGSYWVSDDGGNSFRRD